MLYYINCLLLYSFLGFSFESFIFKWNNSNIHSGIFYGPMTEVYGFGLLLLVLLKQYFFDRLRCNKYLKFFIVFICCFVSLSLIEFIGGTVLNYLFGIDMWNYTEKSFNFGKYICLELALVWGVMGTLFVYFAKDFFDKIIAVIPRKMTYVLIFLNLIDTILVLVTK